MSSFSTNVVHRAACPLAWTSRWTMILCLDILMLSELHKIAKSVRHPIIPHATLSEFFWVPSSFFPFFPHPSSISPAGVPRAGLTQCVPSIHSPLHCYAALCSICTFTRRIVSYNNPIKAYQRIPPHLSPNETNCYVLHLEVVRSEQRIWVTWEAPYMQSVWSPVFWALI